MTTDTPPKARRRAPSPSPAIVLPDEPGRAPSSEIDAPPMREPRCPACTSRHVRVKSTITTDYDEHDCDKNGNPAIVAGLRWMKCQRCGCSYKQWFIS